MFAFRRAHAHLKARTERGMGAHAQQWPKIAWWCDHPREDEMMGRKTKRLNLGKDNQEAHLRFHRPEALEPWPDKRKWIARRLLEVAQWIWLYILDTLFCSAWVLKTCYWIIVFTSQSIGTASCTFPLVSAPYACRAIWYYSSFFARTIHNDTTRLNAHKLILKKPVTITHVTMNCNFAHIAHWSSYEQHLCKLTIKYFFTEVRQRLTL
jgi:hypothetical protein